MKKILILLLALAMLAGCAAPGGKNRSGQDRDPSHKTLPKVGICLPDEADPYWSECARLLQAGLDQIGLDTVVCYAENDVLLQAERVTQLYTRTGVTCLVLAPIDSVALEEALRPYKAGGIPVIALDRPLMDTDAVAFCLSFDYTAIGVAMGRHIEKEKALSTAAQEGRTHTIEFFMGSPDDQNALLLHEGVMSVLQPYIEGGVLVCPSGRVSFEDSWILRWDGQQASQALTRYVQQYYSADNAFPEICCAASDELAAGCIQALETLGCPQDKWPLITGQGYGSEATQAQIDDKTMAVTVVKNLQQLCTGCMEGVLAILSGSSVAESFSENTVNNHVLNVPTRMFDFQVMTRSQEEPSQAPEDIPLETEQILQEDPQQTLPIE